MGANGDRPCVVLLHPLGVDRTFWNPVLPLLAEHLADHDVVAVDLPGHGRGADTPLDLTIESVADDVALTLAEPGRYPVVLVGASLGGIVAQALAARHPEQVDRLVLVDTVAVYPEEMRSMWRERAALARTDGLASFVEPTVRAWVTDPASTVAHWLRRTLAAAHPAGYAAACEALAVADTRAGVAAIRAATLVMCGVEDAPPFRDAARWLARALSGGDVVWLPGRHAAVVEQPAQFIAALTGFLRDGPARRATV